MTFEHTSVTSCSAGVLEGGRQRILKCQSLEQSGTEGIQSGNASTSIHVRETARIS